MGLAKLTIEPLESKLPIFQVLFNPSSYTISKSVNWKTPDTGEGESTAQTNIAFNAPLLQFGGGESRKLSMELFFDVTDFPTAKGTKVRDVRQITDKLVKLTLKQRSGNQELPPPKCRISWGEGRSPHLDFPFVGVIESLTQRFTLFDNQGRPLRAHLDVTFREFLVPEEDRRKNDPEFTTRVVKRGDTLTNIAAEMLGDPARWRIIADANGMDDPRTLPVGMSLSIPKVR